MVKSACGIEAVYMCFNGTGIWGGETLKEVKQWKSVSDIKSNTSISTK